MEETKVQEEAPKKRTWRGYWANFVFLFASLCIVHYTLTGMYPISWSPATVMVVDVMAMLVWLRVLHQAALYFKEW